LNFWKIKFSDFLFNGMALWGKKLIEKVEVKVVYAKAQQKIF